MVSVEPDKEPTRTRRFVVAGERVGGFRDARVEVVDVDWREVVGSDCAVEFDELFGRAARPAVVSERDNWGEDLRDGWAAPLFFGRAVAFCDSSKARAASGVANDLRRRLPLRSYQSARYLFPFSYIGHLWTPL